MVEFTNSLLFHTYLTADDPKASIIPKKNRGRAAGGSAARVQIEMPGS
jgi:hypothetical protein